MPACAVAECNSHTGRKKCSSDVHYHRFPKDKSTIKHWLIKCKRKEVNLVNATVCSRHFTEDDYIRDLKAELLGLPPTKRLKPTAIPSLNLSKNCQDGVDDIRANEEAAAKAARKERRLAREIRQRALRTLASISLEKIPCHQETQTDPIPPDKELIELRKHVKWLKHVNGRLLKEVLKVKETNSKLKAEKKSKVQETKEFTLKVNEHVRQLVGKVFTENQMRFLMNGKTRMIWNRDDINKALAIRAISKKCYLFLRKELNMPLPSVSTLKRWIRQTEQSGNVPLPPPPPPSPPLSQLPSSEGMNVEIEMALGPILHGLLNKSLVSFGGGDDDDAEI